MRFTAAFDMQAAGSRGSVQERHLVLRRVIHHCAARRRLIRRGALGSGILPRYRRVGGRARAPARPSETSLRSRAPRRHLPHEALLTGPSAGSRNEAQDPEVPPRGGPGCPGTEESPGVTGRAVGGQYSQR